MRVPQAIPKAIAQRRAQSVARMQAMGKAPLGEKVVGALGNKDSMRGRYEGSKPAGLMETLQNFLDLFLARPFGRKRRPDE